MNIILADYEDHSVIQITETDDGQILHSYVFNNKDEAKAFMNGWRCCQSVINRLVQRLPQSYETVKIEV